MTSRELRRKALFPAAVKLDRTTVDQWLAEQPNEKTGELGISRAHLYEVINGRTTSAPLLARIDALIARHFPEFAVESAPAA